jgi:hypothetical protein
MSLDLKHTEASFSPSSIDWLCSRVAQLPRSQNMAIFGAPDDRTTDTPITLPLLRMRTRGNYISIVLYLQKMTLLWCTCACVYMPHVAGNVYKLRVTCKHECHYKGLELYEQLLYTQHIRSSTLPLPLYIPLMQLTQAHYTRAFLLYFTKEICS